MLYGEERNSIKSYLQMAAAAKLLQSCPTLLDPMDCSPPGSSVHGIFPGKSTGMGCHCLLQCMKVKSLSRVRLLATPWTVAYQAPLSMGFSRQEYWSGVPLPSPIKIDPNLTTGVLIKTGDVDTETHTQMYLHAKKPHRLLVNQPEAGREVWNTSSLGL